MEAVYLDSTLLFAESKPGAGCVMRVTCSRAMRYAGVTKSMDPDWIPIGSRMDPTMDPDDGSRDRIPIGLNFLSF